MYIYKTKLTNGEGSCFGVSNYIVHLLAPVSSIPCLSPDPTKAWPPLATYLAI